MNQKYCLCTTAYGSPVFVAKDYGWTDNPNKALKWTEPSAKALNEYSRILREDLHFKPVNNTK